MLLRGLEIMIRESFAGSGSVGPGASSDKEDVAEEMELSDLCTLGEKDNEEEEEHQENAIEEATDEEAGKRRRDRLLTEAETMTVNREENNRRRVARSSGCVAVGRSVSDCGDRRTYSSSSSSSSSWPAAPAALHRTTSSRNRSLTDEDMEELRGCIDLGFGFSNDEKDMELCNTLPALELCYAITKRYNDVVGRTSSSPTTISTSQSSSSSSSSSSSFDHHSSNGSNLQSSPPPMDSWRISSPGNKFFPSFLQTFSSTYLVRSYKCSRAKHSSWIPQAFHSRVYHFYIRFVGICYGQFFGAIIPSNPVLLHSVKLFPQHLLYSQF
jgi:hypothetical protein